MFGFFGFSESNAYGNFGAFDLSETLRIYEKRWVTLCASEFARRKASRAKGEIVHHMVNSAQPNLQELEFTTAFFLDTCILHVVLCIITDNTGPLKTYKLYIYNGEARALYDG